MATRRLGVVIGAVLAAAVVSGCYAHADLCSIRAVWQDADLYAAIRDPPGQAASPSLVPAGTVEWWGEGELLREVKWRPAGDARDRAGAPGAVLWISLSSGHASDVRVSAGWLPLESDTDLGVALERFFAALALEMGEEEMSTLLDRLVTWQGAGGVVDWNGTQTASAVSSATLAVDIDPTDLFEQIREANVSVDRAVGKGHLVHKTAEESWGFHYTFPTKRIPIGPQHARIEVDSGGHAAYAATAGDPVNDTALQDEIQRLLAGHGVTEVTFSAFEQESTCPYRGSDATGSTPKP